MTEDHAPATAPDGLDDAVRTALSLLEQLPDLPVEQHPDVFDHTHAALRAILDQ